MTHHKTASAGRRPTKFTPANIQKIKDLVAKGVSRQHIARLLDVPLGSLQVTCSRLGVSLRRRDVANEWRIPVKSRPFISDSSRYSGQMRDQSGLQAKFQVVLERNGRERTTDLVIGASEIQRLVLEASVQNLSMTELMGQVLAKAIKNNAIQAILHEDV
jgi:hypothetical protein